MATNRIQIINEEGGTESIASNDLESIVGVPGVTYDVAHGYGVGNLLLNRSNHTVYECRSATNGAANWVALGSLVGAVLPTDYTPAMTILAADVNEDPQPLVVGANTVVGRAAVGTGIVALPYAAQQILLRGVADLVSQTVASAEFVGRPFGGNLGVVTAAQARTILATTTQAITNLLLGAGTVNETRLRTKTATALPDAIGNITGAAIVGGILTIAATGAHALTTPSTADIVAAMEGAGIGTQFEVMVTNTGAAAPVLTMHGDGTFVGNAANRAIGATSQATFFVNITGVATYSVYRK